MKEYIVRAINLRTNCQVQASDPHSWEECETVYRDYLEDYGGCLIVIVPVKKMIWEETTE